MSLVSRKNILVQLGLYLRDIRLHRASWVQTELFLTFPPPTLGCATLIPRNSDETSGRFRVWLSVGSEPPQLMWDRKVEGGFPELKVLVGTPLTTHGYMLTFYDRRNNAFVIRSSLGSP